MASPKTETKIAPLAEELADYWRAVLNVPVLQQPNEEHEIQLTSGLGMG